MNNLPYIFENESVRQLTEDEHLEYLERIENYIPPIPSAISMRQIRLALIDAKKVTAVNDAIKAISDSVEKAKTQVEWDYGTVVERNAPWFLSIMESIGYTDKDIDSLFLKASSL
jgi:hypothetical protein